MNEAETPPRVRIRTYPPNYNNMSDEEDDYYSEDGFEEDEFEEESSSSSEETNETKFLEKETKTNNNKRQIILHRESPQARKIRMQRLREIYSKIKLSHERFRLYHSPPVKAYDGYMRTINSGNVRQVMTQTNDDARSVRVQTLKPQQKSYAAQIPDDLGFVSGETSSETSYDFKRFLRYSCAMMENILSVRERAIRKSEKIKNNKDDRMIVNSVKLKSKITRHGEVRIVTYDEGSSDHLAIVMVSSSSKSLVEIYSSPSSSEPCRILESFGKISSCCMYNSYVLAGHEDGTVRLLKDNDDDDDDDDLMNKKDDTHLSRVVRVMSIHNKNNNISNRFVSLDDRGTILCWSISSSNMLQKELRLRIPTSFTSIPYGPICQDMGCSDADCILIGMRTGQLVRVSQLRDPAPAPRQFHRDEVLGIFLSAPTVTVTTLDFCPFVQNHVLVGYADGDLSLYNTKHAAPLRTWTSTSKSSSSNDDDTVIRVRWSPGCPGVFFVLFESSELQLWNIIQRFDGPISSTNLYNDEKMVVHTSSSSSKMSMDCHRDGFVCVCNGGDETLQLELGSSYMCLEDRELQIAIDSLRKRLAGLPM